MDRMNEDSGLIAETTVCHVDCDGARHIYRIHGWDHPWHDDPLLLRGLSNALDYFRGRKIRATFFVIADMLDSPELSALLSRAVAEGHEIASHSMTHRLTTKLSADERRREIFDSKARLERELGVTVAGFRAPNFDLDPELMRDVERAGYLYDSSLFPDAVSAKKAGVERIRPEPSPLRRGSALLELPLPGYRPLPWPFHPCYSLLLGGWYFRRGLARHRKTRAPLVLLFHLTDFADPLPRDRTPRAAMRIFTLSTMTAERKAERIDVMLESVRAKSTIVTTEELLRRIAGKTK